MRPFTLPSLTTGVPHPVRVIAAGFNLLTTQQPWAAKRLARHAGKTVRISLAGFAMTLTIDVEGHLEQSDVSVMPDVTLDIDPEKISLTRLFDPNDRQDIAELVHISGQASLAQVVSDLARDLRPDPEDLIAKWVGDLPARRLVLGARGLFNTLIGGSNSAARNLAEYLSEETDALLGRPALQMHIERQEQLRHRLDALDARLAALTSRTQRGGFQKGQKA